MSKSRLEKFLYALYSLDSSDLPAPLSRIEELYKCLVTGEEPLTFEPLSRVEKYLMAILGVYDVDSLPNPLSRVEVLLYKLAIGDDSLEDFDTFLSEHEELLAEIIRNGGAGGNIDIEYVLYTLSTEHNTLYNTAEKPVKSAILKGNTKYRDIDTGDILDTFDETKNLELVSVKMPVLKTTGKNIFPTNNFLECGTNNQMVGQGTFEVYLKSGDYCSSYVHADDSDKDTMLRYKLLDEQGNQVLANGAVDRIFTIENDGLYKLQFGRGSIYSGLYTKIQVQLEEGSTATPYEPFKSNILTVNEDVELRGIGEVKDELDLLTGELTQRIGEYRITGEEEEKYGTDGEMAEYIYITNTSKLIKMKSASGLLCDKFPYDEHWYDFDYPKISSTSVLTFVLPTSITGLSTKEEREAYIRNLAKTEGITVLYELATPIIKTVDLSVVDQDGNNTELSTFDDITHVTLSSEGLIPEAELEVATKNEEDLEDTSVYVAHTLSEELNTLYNTAEKPVKSAILKGQTLVNICEPYEFDIQTTGSGIRHIYDKKYAFNIPIQDDKQYSIWIEIDINEIGAFSLSHTGAGATLAFDSVVGLTLTHGSTIIYPCVKRSNSTNVNFSIGALAGSTEGRLKGRIMVFEGDIRGFELSYFTGMQSVKMPVLTTTGKNLFDGIMTRGQLQNNNVINNNQKRMGYSEFLHIEEELDIYCSYYTNSIYVIEKIYFYDENKNQISMEIAPTKVTSPKGAKYFRLSITTTNWSSNVVFDDIKDDFNIQVETGIQATSYEPYKSNILTANEEVELRGIGDVQDELNCLTGELTQRIGEVVLDGSEKWVYSPKDTYVILALRRTDYGELMNIKQRSIIVSDRYPSGNSENNITGGSGYVIQIFKSLNVTLEEFKNELGTNPATVQYQLATESIKTVDLSVVDQDGSNTKLSTFNDITHVTLSSEGLIPEAEMEVAEKVPEVAANMFTISREQEVINTTINEQSENVDATMIATTEIYEELL